MSALRTFRRAATLALLTLLASPAWGLDSVKLTDVVHQGEGDLDLLRNVTPASLEAFRIEGGGTLTFAIDVNEAADGSEKSGSQGIAFASVTLRATLGGTTHSWGGFYTATQALLAPEGSEVRALTYTAIGDSGSNRITSNAIQAEFDAVLWLPVDQDLSTATSAVLEVRFLQTNAALGDPEAFYDFTNGFEDLALINLTDAAYFEDLAPGVTEAPSVISTAPSTAPEFEVTGWFSYPASGGYYTVGYEDQFPVLGDYDFNDLLVAYQVQVGVNGAGEAVQLKGAAYLIARGSGFSHDWTLRLGTTAVGADLTLTRTDPDTLAVQTTSQRLAGSLAIPCFADSRRTLPSTGTTPFVNTEPTEPIRRGPRLDFTVALDAPLPVAALLTPPFDPFLLVRNTGYEVHLPGQAPTATSLNAQHGLTQFRDAQGYPYAFLFPANWPHPWERVRLELAYPSLTDYVRSQGQTNKDWYLNPNSAKVRSYLQSEWEWYPPPPPP